MKVSIFKPKNYDEFEDKIVDIFKFMSLTDKYHLVGASSLKTSLYATDFDLYETYKGENVNEKEKLEYIAKMFKDKFIQAEKNPFTYIIDFKAGVDDNYDEETQRDKYILRWSKNDMKNGYKIMGDGRKKWLEECLLDKRSIVKMDLVVYINGVFEEFSEIYLIEINGKKNHDPLSKIELYNSIKKDFEKYVKSKNYFKALRRYYSMLRVMGDKKDYLKILQLANFFNSQIGLVYKCKGELETLLNVIETKFKKAPITQLRNTLQIIKQQLSSISMIQLTRDLPKIIDTITVSVHSKDIKELISYLDKVLLANTPVHRFLSKDILKSIQTSHQKLNGGKLPIHQVQSFLKASYQKEAPENIDGYVLDKDLSDDDVKTYYNSITGHAVVAHKGTQGNADWGNNAVFGLGGVQAYKLTPRYRNAERIQKEAEMKYGAKNVSTLGHSQAGLLAELVGRDSKEIITYNKATNPFGLRLTNKNQTDIRASNDPVSAAQYLNPFNWFKKPYADKAKNITINTKATGAEAHNLEQFSLLDPNMMVGE
jgi:hypothetical protein